MIGTTRRHLTALTVATAVVALAACAPSSSSTSGSGSGGSDGKGVTLSVWSWRTEDVAAYDAIFDVYEKAHPGVKVDFKAFKNTEYNQILTTGLAGSNGPDVVQVRSYGQLQPTIASGSLVPLDSTVDLSSWDANVVKSAEGKEDGKLYAVPLAQQTLQMFYNKDLFAKQGLTPPTTWAQFIEVNARLKEQGITPMAVGAKDSWTLPIVHQVLAAPRFGGAAFEKAVLSGQKTFTDPDWVASVDELKALKPYLPDSAVGVAYTDAQILFTSGKAAMFPGGSFELGFFQKQNPALKMGVFQVPAPERLAQHGADDDRLRRRGVRRLDQERRPAGEQGPGGLDGDQGVRPAGRGQGQAAVRGPRCHLHRPAAEADGRQLRQEPQPVPSPGGLPLRHPLRHRRAGHRAAGAAAGQEGRRRGQRRPADRRLPVVQAVGVALMSRRSGLLFVAPALLLFGVFVLYPMVSALSYAFFSWQGTTRGVFVGLSNFGTLFTQQPFREQLPRAFGHNLALLRRDDGHPEHRSDSASRCCCTAGRAPGGCSRPSTPCRYLVSPHRHRLPLDAAAVAARSAPVNALLRAMGLESLAAALAGDPSTALWVVVLVSAWQWVGFPVLLYGAALGGVPGGAVGGGAGRRGEPWQTFRSITLPAAGAGDRHRQRADLHRSRWRRSRCPTHWAGRPATRPAPPTSCRCCSTGPPSRTARPTRSAAPRRSPRCCSSVIFGGAVLATWVLRRAENRIGA